MAPNQVAKSEQAGSVQRLAEELLQAKAQDTPSLPTELVQSLVHQLNARQRELERQNEELRQASDVSAIQSAQRQLQASEQRYRRLIEAVTDYIYRVRIEQGRVVETVHGSNCEAVTGYTAEEFSADPMLWITMVPQDDRAIVEQQAARVLGCQNAPPIEHRIRRKDGQLRWVLNTVSPQVDQRGRLIAYDGLLRDITERKQAEEALLRLNETLERRVAEQTQAVQLQAKAIANLGEGVVITAEQPDWPAAIIIFVNEAMCRISGYYAEDLIGRPLMSLQGGEIPAQNLDDIRKQLAVGRPVHCELPSRRKDGSPYDAEVFITPMFDTTGKRTHFVSVHRDVTDRNKMERTLRESEGRMRAILNTASDAIITIDHRGIIESVNVATGKMFGYAQDEMLGQNVSLLMPSPFNEEHDEYIKRFLETGDARTINIGREVVARHKNGSTFPVGLALSRVEPLGLLTGIVRDNSAVKELQRQVLEIAAEEDRRIGHELHDNTQQQLTGLGLLAQSLAETLAAKGIPEASVASRLAKGINESARHVHLLSRGLVPVEVDAQGLRAALSDLAGTIGEQHNVEFRFHCDRPVEVADNFVATHLYRIAQEAVNNAIKHGRARQIDILLAGGNDSTTLQVLDDGIGIGTQSASGPGMGLRIMNYRAGLIGASLQITAGPAGGTLVTCSLLRRSGA